MPSNGQPLARRRVIRYSAGETEQEHTHEEHQLVYASFGLLSVDTGTSRWLVPPLRALWVPAGTPHSIVARADSEMATLYFDPSVALTGRGDLAVISVSPLLTELLKAIHRGAADGKARAHLEAVILDETGPRGGSDAAPPATARRRTHPRHR